jgi:hypothetical protein
MFNVSKKWLYMILPLALVGCSTKVSRVQTDSTIDLSGRWNDADSRLVAEQIVNDCLGQRWRCNATSASSLKPCSFFPVSWHICSRNCFAKSGMSAIRSRRLGNSMLITFTR